MFFGSKQHAVDIEPLNKKIEALERENETLKNEISRLTQENTEHQSHAMMSKLVA
jgi:cell division protein FtsB